MVVGRASNSQTQLMPGTTFSGKSLTDLVDKIYAITKLAGHLKLSKNRTIFFSSGTVVPPEVTTTTGPRCFSQRLAISFFMLSLSEMSVIICSMGLIESATITTL